MKTREQIHAEFDEKLQHDFQNLYYGDVMRRTKSHIDSIRLQDERDLLEEVVGMRQRNQEVSEYYSGYNKALSDLATRLQERIALLDNGKV